MDLIIYNVFINYHIKAYGINIRIIMNKNLILKIMQLQILVGLFQLVQILDGYKVGSLQYILKMILIYIIVV